MDQPTKNFVATNETRPLDYVCPRRDEQICASADQLPDIVISDYPIDKKAYDQTNTQIFYWNGQPTKNDWARLKAEIIKIRNEKNRSILEKLDFVN